jgi:glycosyltransferase involved in cell wall biosynthesis
MDNICREIKILLPNLRYGGAEKVVISISNELVARGWRVTLVLMRLEGELIPELDKRIEIIDLKCKKIRNTIAPLTRIILSAKSGILWANMWPLTAAATLAWLFALKRGKLFLTEHNYLEKSYVNGSLKRRLILRLALNLLNSRATGITAVSSGIMRHLCQLAPEISTIGKTVYNPACPRTLNKPLRRIECLRRRHELWGSIQTINILSVGEFKPQKNHALILTAISKIRHQGNFKLTLLGDGALMPDLVQQAKALGIGEIVNFPGYVSNTGDWYSTADIFVLSSNWEGFGNVLVEALAYGVSVVSTSCLYGPSEILENGKYGVLIPQNDDDALAQAILDVAARPFDKKLLQKRAGDFSTEIALASYLNVFNSDTHSKA